MRNSIIPSVEVNVIEAAIAGAAGMAFAHATDPSKDGTSAATYTLYGFGAVGLLYGFKALKSASASVRSLCSGVPENASVGDEHQNRHRL